MKNRPGQTLVMLLVFMAIAISTTTAATMLSISNAKSSLRLETSYEALSAAESGMEDALLQLLRDPSYNGGDTLQVGDGTATINVTGGNPLTITSIGSVGGYIRTVRVTGSFVGVIFNINSWTQIY